MGENATADADQDDRDRLVLHVDDRGRVTIPKAVRDRLGIEPGTDVPAYLAGSVLTVDPSPSSRLQPATAGRDDWADTTPTDAGESLFGPMDRDEE
jgi:bifunctional DNA-binding transcriptional regulator/antitoxin component of YhaV-PrlF toxin-antitoxin module